jgi:hypothetical protein
MPKIKLKILFLSSIFCLLVSFVSKAQASTDPQNATPSATATVPAKAGTTGDTTPPTPPILIAPPDGTITSNNKPEFVWRQSSDPDGNTVIYTLYLNNTATYLGISGLGNSAGNGYTARLDGNEVKLSPTTPLADGIYKWYVTASDLSGNTSQSVTWTFTIDNTPPSLTIIDIENYHLPIITEGANFDINGPKDVYFTIESEPFITIRLEIENIFTSQTLTDSQGRTYPYAHLLPGTYSVKVSASDQAGNTTTLPLFTITIHQAILTVPGIPGFTPSYPISYTPLSIPSLPATISKIETRLSLTFISMLLLAIGILALLVLLWYRKYNLVLLNEQGIPLTNTKVYHSIPTTKTSYSPVWMSKREPISYDLVASDHGHLYIRHLGRYSTLTVKTEGKTYILSLSAKRKLYTLILD